MFDFKKFKLNKHKNTIYLLKIDTQSHGYLRISKQDFEKLDISLNEFTAWSFECKNYYYFEEDQDQTTLIKYLNTTTFNIIDLEIEVNPNDWDNFINKYGYGLVWNSKFQKDHFGFSKTINQDVLNKLDHDQLTKLEKILEDV